MVSKRDKKQDISAPSINWLEQLALEINIPFAPEGWFTITQICEFVGRDHQVVRRLLKKRGAEEKQFRHTTKNGKILITAHYKM
jgi:hypothetical protein